MTGVQTCALPISTNTHDLARRLPNSTLIIYPDSGSVSVLDGTADVGVNDGPPVTTVDSS